MILVLGQFPPPINGMSNSTQKMYELIDSCFEKEKVIPINFSIKRNSFKLVIKPLKYLITLFGFFKIIYSGKVKYVYIAVSGGEGLLFELIYILIAINKGIPIGCHYHTNNFVLEKKRVNQFLFSLSADITHILLCGKQLQEIKKKYKVDSRHEMLAMGNAWMYSN